MHTAKDQKRFAWHSKERREKQNKHKQTTMQNWVITQKCTIFKMDSSAACSEGGGGVRDVGPFSARAKIRNQQSAGMQMKCILCGEIEYGGAAQNAAALCHWSSDSTYRLILLFIFSVFVQQSEQSNNLFAQGVNKVHANNKIILRAMAGETQISMRTACAPAYAFACRAIQRPDTPSINHVTSE